MDPVDEPQRASPPLYEPPLVVIAMTDAVEQEVVDRLNNATLRISPEGKLADLTLAAPQQLVLITVVSEGAGDEVGFRVEIREQSDPTRAFNVTRVGIHAVEISTKDQVPIDSVNRADHIIACGPLKSDSTYLLMVLKPPPKVSVRGIYPDNSPRFTEDSTDSWKRLHGPKAAGATPSGQRVPAMTARDRIVGPESRQLGLTG